MSKQTFKIQIYVDVRVSTTLWCYLQVCSIIWYLTVANFPQALYLFLAILDHLIQNIMYMLLVCALFVKKNTRNEFEICPVLQY